MPWRVSGRAPGDLRSHFAPRQCDVTDFDEEALAHLRALTGNPDAEFREGQLAAIRALVEETRRVLVVQRTGWGKSAVYFIATRMLRDRGSGATLLVSPLIALMANQVEAATRMGLRAVVVNSTNHDAWDDIRERLERGEIDLLLVSEQRLANPAFRQDWLPQLGGRVGLVVIDEVHCISDWGHDFRPHYRRIGRFLQLLPAGVPVIGCTATANDRVVDDVETQLGEGLLTIRGQLGREGLRLDVHTDKRRPDARLAWLAHNIPALAGTGVVYCLTRHDVEVVADFLRSHGIDCGTYVGGGTPEENEVKAETLQRFLANELKCVVATSALGMGYDKPDVGFVIHYQTPQSAIAYYQQVGRAGRALDASFGILLAGSEDRDIQDWFIDHAFPSEDEVNAVLEVLDESDGPVRRGQLAVRINMGTGRLDNLMVQLEVEGAVAKVGTGWARTSADWAYPRERVGQVNAWRREEQASMEQYQVLETCRMQHLRRQLDDPLPEPCGICDNCRGDRFGSEPPGSGVAEADARLRRDPVAVLPRKQWPQGLASPTGKIAPDQQLEPGWCLTRAGDGGWGPLVAETLAADGAGGVPSALLAALTELCTERLDPMPEWATFVPSQRRPRLLPALAEALAAALSIPLLDTISRVRVGDPQHTMQNSAMQVVNVADSFEIVGDLPAGRVLLLDDTIDSRWTITVAGVLLRQAGSGPVVPFALAATGP